MTSICFFANGESVHTQRWLGEMVKRKYKVYLITNRPRSIPGVQVYKVSQSSGYLGWFSRIMEIRRLVKKIQPDIVHGHYVTSYGFWAAVCGVKPMVLTAWGSDILVTPKKNYFIRMLTKWSLRKADVITADSIDMLSEIKKYQIEGKLVQIQWGIDLNKFKPIEKQTGDTFNIISTRALEKNYNVGTIIDVFSKIVKDYPGNNFFLNIVGSGTLQTELLARVGELGIKKFVKFHGQVDENLMVELLQKSDLFISIPSSDATAMSLLEAMAVGLPVIVSDLPANRQWVNVEGGVIVSANNKSQIMDAIINIYKKRQNLPEIASLQRETIIRSASRKTEMDRMSEIYQKLASKNY